MSLEIVITGTMLFHPKKLAAKIARKNHRNTQLTTKSLTWQQFFVMRYAPLSLFSGFMINKYK